VRHDALELPFTPGFLHKKDGLVLSIGQFNQWVGAQLMSSGTVQIWPGMPVSEALIEDGKVRGYGYWIKAWTGVAVRTPASLPEWTFTLPSPSSAMGRPER